MHEFEGRLSDVVVACVGGDSNSIFFFQAEDGIRDKLVTGVQTCALPITTSSRGGSPRTPPPTAIACGPGSKGTPRDLLRRPATVRTRARALRHLGGDLPRDEAHPRRRGAGVARSDGDRRVAGPAPRGTRTRPAPAHAVREVALARAARRPRP